MRDAGEVHGASNATRKQGREPSTHRAGWLAGSPHQPRASCVAEPEAGTTQTAPALPSPGHAGVPPGRQVGHFQHSPSVAKPWAGRGGAWVGAVTSGGATGQKLLAPGPEPVALTGALALLCVDCAPTGASLNSFATHPPTHSPAWHLGSRALLETQAPTRPRLLLTDAFSRPRAEMVPSCTQGRK